jgi:hypothetical protein
MWSQVSSVYTALHKACDVRSNAHAVEGDADRIRVVTHVRPTNVCWSIIDADLLKEGFKKVTTVGQFVSRSHALNAYAIII